MPESYMGENIARAVAISSGTTTDRFQEALKILMFRLSNNLHAEEGASFNSPVWDTVFEIFLANVRPAMTPQQSGFLDNESYTWKACKEKLLLVALERFLAAKSTEEDPAFRVLRWLLHAGQDPNTVPPNECCECGEERHTLLQHAVCRNSVQAAKLFIEFGANVDMKTQSSPLSPLALAFEYGWRRTHEEQEDLVALLLSAGAGKPATGFGCYLNEAISQQLHKIIQLLDEHGANFCYSLLGRTWMTDRDTAIATAAGIGDIALEFINTIASRVELPHGHPPAYVDALIRAAHAGNQHAVKYFLDLGGDLRLANCFGNTPLHAAVLSGEVSMCSYLLDNGANVKAVDTDSVTPLHLAAFRGHYKILELLIDNGADVNLVFTKGPRSGILRRVSPIDLFGGGLGYSLKKNRRFFDRVIAGLSSTDPLSICMDISL